MGQLNFKSMFRDYFRSELWYCYFVTNIVNSNILILYGYLHLFLFLPNGDIDLIA